MVLKDRIAIVTGGSSGIGRGIAIEFAREGAKVVVADIREAPKQGKYHDQDVTTPTVAEIEGVGGEAIFLQTDVADTQQIERMIDTTVERFGGLDILMSNAGVNSFGDIEHTSLEDWDRVIGVNQRAAFWATRLAVPHLKKSGRGRILYIASVLAFVGGGGIPYAASKSALVNMVRDLALDLGPSGVTANAICPGYIETPIQDWLTADQIEKIRGRTPLPRFGKPRDIGRAAVFLASEDAEWITGASLVVDGGLLCNL